MTLINGELRLRVWLNFPLTMSALKMRTGSISKRSVTLNGVFVLGKKKMERKENITAATWRWQLHQSCTHLEQQHHTPLNTEHQSVVDRVLISALMMRYFFVHCCDRQREGEWGQRRGNNGKINFMHDCGGER